MLCQVVGCRLASRIPVARDGGRTDSPGCRNSHLRRHAASAGPQAECGLSWHTGATVLSTRHSSLFHTTSHHHRRSFCGCVWLLRQPTLGCARNLPQGTYPSAAVLPMPGGNSRSGYLTPSTAHADSPRRSSKHANPVYLRQLAYSLSALGGIRTLFRA